MPAGRPTDYRPEYAERARKLCEDGLIDVQLAVVFGVAESTIYLWKQEHPEFSEAISAGKEVCDQRVEKSLLERALGYKHDEDKIFLGRDDRPIIVQTTKHYPPEVKALSLWLRNRQPQRWRDKQQLEVEVEGGGRPIQVITGIDEGWGDGRGEPEPAD